MNNGIISLDGDNTIRQPYQLKEELVRRLRDSTSINGTVRRAWYADKWSVTMDFTGVSIAEYNALAQYIYINANPVVYANSFTGVNFTGFITPTMDVFQPGSTWLKNVNIIIQEQ